MHIARTVRLSMLGAFFALPASAQTATDHLALGDRDYQSQKPDAALRHYEAALVAEPKYYEALWKASRSEIDLGELANDTRVRNAHYERGEAYARRAVEARADDPEGHFHLARSLGRTALTKGPRDKVRYGTAVREHALVALRMNPKHPGALHVMGMWNAEIMRLSGFTRFIARNLLGGKVFDSASWSEAVRYMEESVAAEPWRIIHRADLAEIYAEVGEKAKARAQMEQILKLPEVDPKDPVYRKNAEEWLRRNPA